MKKSMCCVNENLDYDLEKAVVPLVYFRCNGHSRNPNLVGTLLHYVTATNKKFPYFPWVKSEITWIYTNKLLHK